MMEARPEEKLIFKQMRMKGILHGEMSAKTLTKLTKN